MRSTKFVALLAIPAQLAFAQQAPATGHDLTLDQAITIARQNNPGLLQTRNLVRNAETSVRLTYGALLPNASASLGGGYTQAGTQLVQGIPFTGENSYNGSYRVGFNYSVSASAAFAPRAARANRAAAEATVASSTETLRSVVTTQYIQALEQQATATMDDSLVLSAKGQLNLADAKMEVGAGTILDVRNAEVQVGQAEVASVTAHNQAQIEKVKLFQQMGVPYDTAAVLTTTFTVSAQPPASLDSLLSLARRVNPDVAAKRSTEYADNMQVHSAETGFLPTLSLNTGIGGTSFGTTQSSDNLVEAAMLSNQQNFESCLSQDSLRAGAGLPPRSRPCALQQLSATQIQNIRNSNDPFAFRKTPITFSAFLSLPIFNNYQREANIEQARVARDNAIFDLKARNLQLTSDVTSAYLNLVTAEKTVELQQTIAQQAAQALAFAEESYRVGAKTFLDLTTARGQFVQASVGRINAIYTYHQAFANLEAAVGRPLR
ncbi:MAG TPA: TolC family protein [Gemmatimonadaceae bacterium]|nr:TolC family protein [Gemmatimonadaceae bacterium]